jgi:phosphatidylglycerol:prolipoprotein diacylglycerol transferase
MFPIIRIGPVAMQTPIVALVIALWVGAYVAERECKRRGLSGDAAWNLIAVVAATTLIAARLIYAAQNFSAYASDPFQIFSPASGTLALDYGAMFGALAAYAYIQRRKMAKPPAPLLDSLAPGALIALAIFSLGQFLSGDGYGTPTNLPWAVFMWDESRHPVQLYDALLALMGWIVLSRVEAREGMIALSAVIWYSASRLVVDALRADAAIIANGFRVSQVIALGILLIGLWMISRRMEAA